MSFPQFTPPAAQDYLETILEQFRETANLSSIVEFIGEQTDWLWLANRELYDFYDVDLMGGVNLDILGRIVDVPRNGDSDASYRPRIKLGLSAQANGTPDEVLATVRGAFGASYAEYIPEYPAAFFILTDADGLTREELETISPAGVGAYPACILALTTGQLVETTAGESILLIGPCQDKAVYPLDNVWDAGYGAIDPDAMVLSDPWPFRDGNGVGTYPDGGYGLVAPEAFTFTDGTYAIDLGG